MNSLFIPKGLRALPSRKVSPLKASVSVVRAPVIRAAIAYPSEEANREDLGAGPSSMRQEITMKGMGSFSGATIERAKLSQKSEQKQINPRLDDNGGGGNNGGKILGGGGGGDDGGDDDDYMNFDGEGEGEGDGNSWFRQTFPENYSREAIAAILSEWFKTIAMLPLWLRGLVEMGLFSSQQLARFFTLDMRPSLVRNVSRNLPVDVQRELVGRLMADPAFLNKLVVDQGLTVALSLLWESVQRGPNFTKELDYVAANTLALCFANGMGMWLLAPSRSFGSAYKLPFQEMLANLPNNVFDKSTKHKQFTIAQRMSSAVAKAAELSAVGAIAGATMSAAGSACTALRRNADPSFDPSIPVASPQQSALGMAAFMALVGNGRYQLLNGLDRYAFERASILPVYLATSTLARAVSHWGTQDVRLATQGLPQGLLPWWRVTEARKAAAARRTVVKKRVVKKVVKKAAPAEAAPVPVAATAGGPTI